MPMIYYAHPMSWYDTDKEKEDVDFLAKLGHLVNPNHPSFEDEVEAAKLRHFPVMDVFAKFIRDTADVVAFRRFKDGKIGAGVAREVLEAWIWGKEIWEVIDMKYEIHDHQVRPAYIRWRDGNPLSLKDVCTVEETRRRITEGVL